MHGTTRREQGQGNTNAMRTARIGPDAFQFKSLPQVVRSERPRPAALTRWRWRTFEDSATSTLQTLLVRPAWLSDCSA